MADYSDFKDKNTKFTGTVGERISPGTTLERVDETGRLRFNLTNQLMEYYDGNSWKSIDAPPVVSSITPTTIASDGSTIFTITVSGDNFSLGATAKWIGNDTTEYTPSVVTRNSATSMTVTTTTAMTVANEPYSLTITNTSGLAGTLGSALDAGSSPAFSASAGSLGTLGDSSREATNLSPQTLGPEVDADGQQINYTVTSGSLPSGFTLGTPNDGNNGKIIGTANAVGSNTTSNFTITASDGVNTVSRAFSITINAPTVTSYTSTGPFSFPVPSGISAVRAVVIAGGGGGGYVIGGGGGAGGMIDIPSFSVTPGGSVSGTVGGGGGGGGGRTSPGSNGGNSTFGSLTAIGGGGGASWDVNGQPGGSGGGSTNDTSQSAGTGTQPSQPGDSGTYGYGNNGGIKTESGTGPGAGGGGAGSAGRPAANGVEGTGGNGRNSDVSGSTVTYAGGGGGGGYSTPNAAGGPGGGGPGGPNTGTPGTGNRGSGGGGGYFPPDQPGGSGGSGIVVIRY